MKCLTCIECHWEGIKTATWMGKNYCKLTIAFRFTLLVL